jgi:putative lipoprotein
MIVAPARLGRTLCLPAVLVGCSAPQVQTPAAPPVVGPPKPTVFDTVRTTPPRTYVFQCADGLRFVARTDGESASVFLPGRTLHLRHVSAASGAKYSDGRVMFWGKGEEATLEFDGSRHTCQNDRHQAVWEDARLRGIDFRATGNEPAWFLELVDGGRSVLATHYGEARHEFKTPPPSIDRAAGVTTYRVSSPALVVVIRTQACRDTMSGDRYETAVTVTVDGRTFRGCGRALR